MIYLIVQHLFYWLQAHHLGFLRVFLTDTFQATAAIVVSFSICLILGPGVIAWLRRQKIGDLATFDQAEIDALMASKRGTPTMGGVLIIASIVGTTLLLADLGNFYVVMALIVTVLLGGLGAVDDWLKLTAGRRAGSRVGLTTREKLVFQLAIGIIFSIFIYRYGGSIEEARRLYFPFVSVKRFSVPLGLVCFVLIGTVVLTGSSNAVNLTDGLDGLASGCMAITAFTFLVLALLAGDSALSQYLLFPHIRAAGQMAVLAGATVGACLGFLWFNCNPARVFMGDTGSLAMGGLLGYIAVVIRQEILLVFVGGIFVAEAISVLMQVGWFKFTRIRTGTGRRIFLMAPLHHHFQKKGWTENQVVVRFWLVGFMLAAMALATVKLR
jgi:phospho-N-acetylmuramoyl-pentapeptide-transferase